MIFQQIRKYFSLNSNAISTNESIKLMLTAVFTSWLSPVTVWSNLNKAQSFHLLGTGITNIISMYVMVATIKLLEPEIMLYYLEAYRWENIFAYGYAYLSIIAAIVLCCAVFLQFLGNPNNIYKVSKYCCFGSKPIVSRGMIYDFLNGPAAFDQGSINFKTSFASS